jgi:RNA polymerase sigma factor (sigma-70 family)
MRSVNYSDTELLNGLISRDERILKEFYTLYFQGIRRHVLSNHGNNEDAKDLFHEVLLVLFQKARIEDFQLTSALGTYLYAISKFLWLKELGKRKRISHQMIDHEALADEGEEVVQINEKNERLLFFRACFEKLSANCRKVLSLFTEGFSIAEITEIMGYKSDQHTRNRRYRCKLSLINSIKSAYDYNKIKHGNDTHN